MAVALTMAFQQGSARADSYNNDVEFEAEMSEFLRPPDELDTNLDPDSQPDILNQPGITDQPKNNTAGDIFRELGQKAEETTIFGDKGEPSGSEPSLVPLEPQNSATGGSIRLLDQAAQEPSGLSDKKNKETDFVYPKNLMSPD